MPRVLTYALMLTAALGLAACDKPSEDAAEDAREARSEAQDSMNDAAEQQRQAAQKEAEAAQQRAEENREATPAPISPPPANPQ